MNFNVFILYYVLFVLNYFFLHFSLVKDNFEYERAAAIALFNLKIGKAVEILSGEHAMGGKCTLMFLSEQKIFFQFFLFPFRKNIF